MDTHCSKPFNYGIDLGRTHCQLGDVDQTGETVALATILTMVKKLDQN